jgi:hypothetical protein
VPPPTDTPSSPPTPVPTPTPIPQPEATVATKVLNVRSGPGANYSRVGQAKEGERLKVVGRTEASNWLKIMTSDGKEGWVSTEFGHTYRDRVSYPRDVYPYTDARPRAHTHPGTPHAHIATPADGDTQTPVSIQSRSQCKLHS